jgi:hypothetical protein
MKYHGNYCGPWWSGGKYQSSVIDDTVLPIDEFDETCRIHDAAYANAGDLDKADLDFYNANILQGAKRAIAAIAVRFGSQHAGTKMRANLRGSLQAKQNALRKVARTDARLANRSTTVASVPAAAGFTITSRKAIISRGAKVTSIIGSDFAGKVAGQSTNSTYGACQSVLLNPAYYANAGLGALSRSFEKFRFVKAELEYIPTCSTATTGQVVMCSSRSLKEPFLDGGSSSFLNRAMSQDNTIVGPLWDRHIISIECPNEWFLVDPLIDGDLDDSIAEEIQVYIIGATTLLVGILRLHYHIEFKDPLYTYHPTLIPVPVGNGTLFTVNDDGAINAINDAFKTTVPSSFPSGNGNIYRMVFQLGPSVLPTGVATWGALAKFQVLNSATTATTDAQTTNLTFADGTTLYAVQNGSILAFNTSYEACLTGNASGSVFYQTATTAQGSYNFITALVRLGDLARVTIQ